MLTFKWKGIKDLNKGLIRVESQVDKGAVKFATEAVKWLQKDIRGHWSRRSPSSKGNAPAIQTGNLDSAIANGMGQGRDLGGRFAKQKDIKVMFLTINTDLGDRVMGRHNYAQELEKEMDRPFVAPAIKRLKAEIGFLSKRYIKIRI